MKWSKAGAIGEKITIDGKTYTIATAPFTHDLTFLQLVAYATAGETAEYNGKNVPVYVQVRWTACPIKTGSMRALFHGDGGMGDIVADMYRTRPVEDWGKYTEAEVSGRYLKIGRGFRRIHKGQFILRPS